MSSTPPPPPPPPPSNTPPPPPPPPPPGSGRSSGWDGGFLDGPPTSTVPKYDTQRFGAVPPGQAVNDAYGFPIGDPAGAGGSANVPPIGAVGQDADGDGVLDSVQEAEAEAAEDAAAAAAAVATRTEAEAAGKRTLRRRGSIWPTIIGLVGPFILIIAGLTFMTTALNPDGSDDSPSSESSDDSTTAPEVSTADESSPDQTTDGSSVDAGADPVAPPPEVVLGADGDPLNRAVEIAQAHAVARSDGAAVPPRVIIVRSENVGPDIYALRLVVVRYVGGADSPTARPACVDWDVNLAGAVVTEVGETSLGEEDGVITDPVREAALRATCDAESVG